LFWISIWTNGEPPFAHHASHTADPIALGQPNDLQMISLIMIASASDIRWFFPPPHRTAYFCRSRQPGKSCGKLKRHKNQTL